MSAIKANSVLACALWIPCVTWVRVHQEGDKQASRWDLSPIAELAGGS